jgi:hypothetical protein
LPQINKNWILINFHNIYNKIILIIMLLAAIKIAYLIVFFCLKILIQKVKLYS